MPLELRSPRVSRYKKMKSKASSAFLIALTISSKSGHSPESSLEWSNLPLARISKAPPLDGINESDLIRSPVKNFGRQTDGLRRVVSNDAVFD